MHRLTLSLAHRLTLSLAALAALAPVTRADVILNGDGIVNNDSSSFVNPPPNINRHFPPGSPSGNGYSPPPVIGTTTTLPFNNAYTYLDATGMPVGSVASNLSGSVSYTQLTPASLQIGLSVTDSNEGHTLNNSGWRSTNTSSTVVSAGFSLTTPTDFTYHQTSFESFTGAYTDVGTLANLLGPLTITGGPSILNVFGNEGTAPTLDYTTSGVLPAGTYTLALGGLVNGETIFYGGNDFTTTTNGAVTLTLTPAPEPASLTLAGLGLLGLGAYRWRRRWNSH